jgi:hypothetical protein
LDGAVDKRQLALDAQPSDSYKAGDEEAQI